jgi:hypothetical protein
MKKMNLPEIQLRSWHPRQPSPNLKRQIFSTSRVQIEIAWAFRLLAPAAACLLMALAVFNQGNLSGRTRYEPFMALSSSNQSYMTFLPGGHEYDHNDFSRLTFEWTNRSGSTSSISSFSPGRMN